MKALLCTYGGVFPKKYARIVWTLDENRFLDKFSVCRIYKRSQVDHLEAIIGIGKDYYDIGNCLFDWEDWKFEDVLLAIFKYPIKDPEVVTTIFQELGKIEEWKIKLMPYNNAYWKDCESCGDITVYDDEENCFT